MRMGTITGICLILGAAGCAPKAFVRPGLLDHPPRRVAVLPFVITYPYDLEPGQTIPDSHRIGRDLLRKTFFYAITPYGYQDVKLAEVDERLTFAWGPIDDGTWQAAPPEVLGQVVGADALIYGDINRLMHVSTPLYTETSLDASLRMVDAQSGEVLWRKGVRIAERGGALMKKGQVVDFVKDQVRSFNPSIKFLRVADTACRQLLRDFPNPSVPADSWANQPLEELTHGTIRLALLPFEADRESQHNTAESLRRYLMANLQQGPFEIIELGQVDAALKQIGVPNDRPITDPMTLMQLAQVTHADLILRGKLTKWGRTYLVVQSWVRAGLQLELVDAQSGETIWSETKNNTRQAGLLKGPTGYQSLVTAPLKGLLPGHLDRVGSHLTQTMAEDLLSAPAVLAYLSERDTIQQTALKQ